MTIFRRDPSSSDTQAPSEPQPGRPAASPSSPAVSRIAPGSRMEGQIRGTTDVVVDGELEGEVEIEGTVRIGRGGRVRGALMGREVEVAGKVEGDVSGRELITLDASAELEGDLSAPRVVIHEGAFFKGEVEMTGGESSSPTRSSPPPATPSRSTSSRSTPSRSTPSPSTPPRSAPETEAGSEEAKAEGSSDSSEKKSSRSQFPDSRSSDSDSSESKSSDSNDRD